MTKKEKEMFERTNQRLIRYMHLYQKQKQITEDFKRRLALAERRVYAIVYKNWKGLNWDSCNWEGKLRFFKELREEAGYGDIPNCVREEDYKMSCCGPECRKSCARKNCIGHQKK